MDHIWSILPQRVKFNSSTLRKAKKRGIFSNISNQFYDTKKLYKNIKAQFLKKNWMIFFTRNYTISRRVFKRNIRKTDSNKIERFFNRKGGTWNKNFRECKSSDLAVSIKMLLKLPLKYSWFYFKLEIWARTSRTLSIRRCEQHFFHSPSHLFFVSLLHSFTVELRENSLCAPDLDGIKCLNLHF